ncbi:MAG: hypothetical protein NTU41_14225 [Chloroflexi bacterium]|nr:hypothetical protein [Chloroflexota bacterium]
MLKGLREPFMQSSPKLPYIRKIDERGRLLVWLVDGSYIRGHMDEEFTNFGQHCQFSFIPANELWIDHAANSDDQRFFIENMLVMHRLVEKGVPYDEALAAAERQERQERRRAGDLKRLTDHGRKLPEGKDVHERLWQKLSNGVSIWIVNGRLVRSVFDIEFTEGGHDHVYEFVPENEVWIDNDLQEDERPYVLLHELHERNLMDKGWPYSKAHADASRLEYRCRHHPDELHGALVAEGWG